MSCTIVDDAGGGRGSVGLGRLSGSSGGGTGGPASLVAISSAGGGSGTSRAVKREAHAAIARVKSNGARWWFISRSTATGSVHPLEDGFGRGWVSRSHDVVYRRHRRHEMETDVTDEKSAEGPTDKALAKRTADALAKPPSSDAEMRVGDDDEPGSAAQPHRMADVISAFSQPFFVILLGGVLWFYRTLEASKLGISLTAIVVVFVAARLDRIKTLTSKIVSFETREFAAVRRRAENATTSAKDAANQARETAQQAHEAAEKATAAASQALTAAQEATAKVDKAATTMRDIVSALTTTLLSSVAQQGRLGAASLAGRMQLVERTTADLLALGCSSDQVNGAVATIRASVHYDLGSKVLERIGALYTKANAQSREMLEAYGGKVLPLMGGRRGGFMDIAKPQTIRDFATENKISLDDKILRESLDRYERFCETGTLSAVVEHQENDE